MRYKDMFEHNALQRKLRDEAYTKAEAHQTIDPTWQLTLASGTRCTITGFLDDRLQLTYYGGNVWADKEQSSFLTLGMLSVPDQRELLEIRWVIEEWRAGKLDELPRYRDFERWRCPPGFAVELRERVAP